MNSGRPWRIALATTFYPPFNFGGDGVAVRNLARALVRRGHDVTVVHDTDGFRALDGRVDQAAQPDGAANEPPPDGVRVVRIGTRAPFLSSLITQQLGIPGLKKHALAAALAASFDVVHFHNVSLLGGPGALRMASGMSSGVSLYTAHEHWLVCPTHVLWRDGREPCTSRHCVRCTIRQGRPPQLWRYTPMLTRAMSRMDAVIAQSEFSRAKHAEYGFRQPMRVLPPVPGDDIIADAARDGARDAVAPVGPYVLFAGRLERPKGVDDLLRVFARPGSAGDAALVIAGEGSERARWEREAAGNPRIRFVGQVDATRLGALYAHASALVVPSLGYETFGLVVVEGMRAGVPVVARRRGSFPELLAMAGAGSLFDTDDELDAQLTRAVVDEAWRAQTVAAGREAFARHWSEDAVMPRYLDLVGELTARRADPTPRSVA